MALKVIDDARADLPGVELTEIDITERPDVAVRYRVMATPAIAIDGRLEFTRVPEESVLRARLRAAMEGKPR